MSNQARIKKSIAEGLKQQAQRDAGMEPGPPATAQLEGLPPFMPVPTLVDVSQVSSSGRLMVQMTWATPAGLNAYFLDPDTAMEISEEIRRAAGQAGAPPALLRPPSGLVVPT